MRNLVKLKTINRKATLIFIVVCSISLASAFFVGVNGNPLGIFLCYLAATTLILAFTCTWHRLKSFLILLGISLVGFFLFVVLHNVFYAFAELAADMALLNGLFKFLHAMFFLIAIFICPMGFLVGLVGIAVMVMRRKLWTRRDS